MKMMNLMYLIIAGLLVSSSSHSTALKVCNDTEYSWRVRVDGDKWQVINSQGACKCYQSKNCPNRRGDIHNVGWVDIANKVKDEWYRVEFEYYGSDGSWYRAFSIKMQGDYFTNIAQIIDLNEDRTQVLRMWWEPARQKRGDPKCRDKPPLEGCRTYSCLVLHRNDPEYSHEY